MMCTQNMIQLSTQYAGFAKKTIFDLPIMLPERSRKHLEKGALAN